jgi:hypothetical protein
MAVEEALALDKVRVAVAELTLKIGALVDDCVAGTDVEAVTVDDVDELSAARTKKPTLQKPPPVWSPAEPSASTMWKWNGIDLLDHMDAGLTVHSN